MSQTIKKIDNIPPMTKISLIKKNENIKKVKKVIKKHTLSWLSHLQHPGGPATTPRCLGVARPQTPG